MREGFFICLEGLDKSGKTTQAHLLVRSLRLRGFNAVYTTEPSRGEIGRFIRRHILQRERRGSVAVEALLFAADRIDHGEREIKPMLRERKIVVSDRYLYSSLAYQGAAGLDIGWIMEINKMAPVPDLAIYLDVPLHILSKRRARRDRSVMEWPQIQQRVHKVYMKLVQEGKLIPINGNRPIEEVSIDILNLVLQKLGALK